MRRFLGLESTPETGDPATMSDLAPCEHVFEPVPLEGGWYFCTKCRCRAEKKLRKGEPPQFVVFKTKHENRPERWIGRHGSKNPRPDHNDIHRSISDRSGFIRTDKLRRGEK